MLSKHHPEVLMKLLDYNHDKSLFCAKHKTLFMAVDRVCYCCYSYENAVDIIRDYNLTFLFRTYITHMQNEKKNEI